MTSPAPCSTEHLDGCETELRAALPELYSDPAQREIVERVLIAQLRAILGKTVTEVTLPLAPRAIDTLCASVDGALAEHKDLLDTDGLLRQVMPKINEVRQRVRAELKENFKAACRAALAEHKIHDRRTLFYRGSEWFRLSKFPPFGGGNAFASKILRRKIKNVNNALLVEIAEELNLPLHSEEQALAYREILAVQGILDWETLMRVTRNKLRRMDFPPCGGPAALFSEILGEPQHGNIDSPVRQLVADRIGFSKPTPEEEKIRYRAVLAAHGIDDRGALYVIGVRKYVKMNFPPYGTGERLLQKVLNIQDQKTTLDLMVRMADTLDLPIVSETRKQEYIALLASNNIHNRSDLKRINSQIFKKIEFGPHGKGQAFVSRILARTVYRITHKLLDELADALGW